MNAAYRRYLNTVVDNPAGGPAVDAAWRLVSWPRRVWLCWNCYWLDGVQEACPPLGRLLVRLIHARRHELLCTGGCGVCVCRRCQIEHGERPPAGRSGKTAALTVMIPPLREELAALTTALDLADADHQLLDAANAVALAAVELLTRPDDYDRQEEVRAAVVKWRALAP